MGCGAGKAMVQASVQGQRVAVLVLGATGLRDADSHGDGSSDPYVVCRAGKVGSAWGQKARETESRSHTAWNTTEPAWRHAFQVVIPVGFTAATWELQLRVFDRDLLDADDCLGELVLPISALQEHLDDSRPYKLQRGGNATGAMGKDAAVELMVGDKVEAALVDDLKHALGDSKTGDWDYAALLAITRCSSLRTLTPELFNTPVYYSNTLQMAAAWIASLTKGRDPSAEWFIQKTKNGGKEDTYKWDGPELNSRMFSGHADIVKLLAEYGSKCGTSAVNGQVYHPNMLGVQILTDKIWPEVPWRGIGLAAPQDARQKLRPFITKLCARWAEVDLQNYARDFFTGRDTIVVNDDLRVWTTRVLHRIFIGCEVSEAEGASFMAMQRKVLVMGASGDLGDVPPFRELLGFDEVLAFKEGYVAKIQAALATKNAEFKRMTPQEQTCCASAVLDAMLFAGGQSVPTVLQYCLALPYSQWGHDSLPADFSLDNTSTMPAYIWEVIRRFAPVTFFPYRERGTNGARDQTVYLNLQMAQRDPRVWGADAGDFKLRPLAEYHQKSVGFCEPGLAPTLASPGSRACPAKDLAFAMCLAFMTEFARSVAELLPPGPASVAKVWRPRSDTLTDGRYQPIAPADIHVNLFGTTTFRLEKDVAVGTVPAPRSGHEYIDKLDSKGKAFVAQNVHRRNKFCSVNTHTTLIIAAVQNLARPESRPSYVCAPPDNETEFQSGDVWQGPFAGLRLITRDEDLSMRSTRVDHLANALAHSVVQGGDQLPLGEDHLVWFDSPAEAVACVDATFGRYLPPATNHWEHLGSDAMTAQLCTDGAGAWYLRRVTPPAAAGHEQPAGATLEVNLEYLGKYETRSPWVGYGHTAYLGGAGDAAQPRQLLGIWSCHHKRLIKPGDELWDHAKAGFRSSLGVSLTLNDHLATCHWICANGLMCAVRESCGRDHPLRRLLKQFHFGTASINAHAKDVLMPVDALGYRVFGFTPTSWVEYFKDVFDNWSWVSFPDRLKARELPPEFLASWSFKQDGEALWQAFHKYAGDYLHLFYAGDAAVQRDEGVKLFWAHFDKYIKWQLPPLTFANLTKLLADTMWWVTGGHEFVGAIVEYLTTPMGMANKLVDGKIMPDVQTFAQALGLISLTGLRMPMLMDDWTHIFTAMPGWAGAKQQAVVDLVRRFQADLAALADKMDKANFERERRGQHRMAAFNPRILESSVSI